MDNVLATINWNEKQSGYTLIVGEYTHSVSTVGTLDALFGVGGSFDGVRYVDYTRTMAAK